MRANFLQLLQFIGMCLVIIAFAESRNGLLYRQCWIFWPQILADITAFVIGLSLRVGRCWCAKHLLCIKICSHFHETSTVCTKEMKFWRWLRCGANKVAVKMENIFTLFCLEFIYAAWGQTVSERLWQWPIEKMMKSWVLTAYFSERVNELT